MSNNNIKKVSDHIKEQNANQQSKMPVTPKAPVAPVEAPKAPVEANVVIATPVVVDPASKKSKIDILKETKRKNDEDWKFILAYKDKEGLKSDNELAEVFGVTVSNIHQKRAKFKKDQEVVAESKLSTSSLVEDAKKLLAGIAEELKVFDDSIEEAKSKVANAATERAKIEAKTDKFKLIIEAFS